MMRRPRHGLRFDDGFHSGVKKLVIRHEGTYDRPWWLHSIEIKYHDGNAISNWSEVHGCENLNRPSTKITMIKLDYPNEYLTAIYGYDEIPWPDLPCLTVIRSISFKSNKRTYGPFGDPIGQFFADDMRGTMIVGFYGRSLPSYGLILIGTNRKRLDSHQICPPKDLLPAGDSLRNKLKKDEDDNTNDHITPAVSNNQISKNHGDGNGVGNKIINNQKYVQKEKWKIIYGQ